MRFSVRITLSDLIKYYIYKLNMYFLEFVDKVPAPAGI